MAEAGIPRDHIAKVLNHVEGGPAATRVYDRYNYDAEKRDALDRWARRLAAIIEGKSKKVVPIRVGVVPWDNGYINRTRIPNSVFLVSHENT